MMTGANMHTNGKYSKYITEDRVNKGLNKGVEAYEKHQQKKGIPPLSTTICVRPAERGCRADC